MKKILFLIPLLGICSSMLAQAPTVTNVQAEQTQGTKDVAISFELTGKDSGGGTGSMINGEVWFKESESKTTWTKVSSVGTIDQFSGTFTSANLSEWTPDTGTDTLYPTFHLGEAGLSPVAKNFIWKAGDDAPNINTADAKIRIIAFYPKMNEYDATEKPAAEQVSGWNGEGDFGGSGGSPDGNGTSPSGDVYVRDYSDPNSYMVSFDPVWPNLRDRIQEQYGISPIAPTSYYDEASSSQLDVFELPDSIVQNLTGVMPPSGTLLCAVVGDNLIPVMLQ